MVGAVGRPKSMARVARYDGLLPYVMEGVEGPLPITPAQVRSTLADVADRRGDAAGFDVIVEGQTGPDSAITPEHLSALENAGVTWWLETMWNEQKDPSAVEARIRLGPTV